MFTNSKAVRDIQAAKANASQPVGSSTPAPLDAKTQACYRECAMDVNPKAAIVPAFMGAVGGALAAAQSCHPATIAASATFYGALGAAGELGSQAAAADKCMAKCDAASVAQPAPVRSSQAPTAAPVRHNPRNNPAMMHGPKGNEQFMRGGRR